MNCPTGELIAVPFPVTMRPPLNVSVAFDPVVLIIVGETKATSHQPPPFQVLLTNSPVSAATTFIGA